MISRLVRLSAALAAAPVMLLAFSADAATSNHGTFTGSTVTFSDVTEDNLGSSLLYNGFNVFNDSLLFDPNSFGVQVSPGSGSKLIDSELQMMISANPGYALTLIGYGEEGDYTLSGSGKVSAGLPYFWEILEVDGVSIPPISGNGQTSFSSTTPATGQLWNLGFNLDLNQQLTLAEGILGEVGTYVTKINLRFDNSLTATADNAASVAFIKKKQIAGINVDTMELVPEPASALSLFVGLIALGIRRRKISG